MHKDRKIGNIKFFNKSSAKKLTLSREEVKKKAIEGAEKAIKEYDETFKILTEYDK